VIQAGSEAAWLRRVKARVVKTADDESLFARLDYPHLYVHSVAKRERLVEPGQLRPLFVDYDSRESVERLDRPDGQAGFVEDIYTYRVGWWGRCFPLKVVVRCSRNEKGEFTSACIDAHSVFTQYLQELVINR
jgi:hypothetical protein